MNKYEYFEFRYSQSNDRCIEEMGKLPELYDNYQMKNMCEYFFDIGFDMRSNKFKELEQQLKEASEVLKGVVDDLYTPYRLGLGELPNPQWTNLNKARNYLTKYKVKE